MAANPNSGESVGRQSRLPMMSRDLFEQRLFGESTGGLVRVGRLLRYLPRGPRRRLGRRSKDGIEHPAERLDRVTQATAGAPLRQQPGQPALHRVPFGIGCGEPATQVVDDAILVGDALIPIRQQFVQQPDLARQRVPLRDAQALGGCRKAALQVDSRRVGVRPILIGAVGRVRKQPGQPRRFRPLTRCRTCGFGTPGCRPARGNRGRAVPQGIGHWSRPL